MVRVVIFDSISSQLPVLLQQDGDFFIMPYNAPQCAVRHFYFYRVILPLDLQVLDLGCFCLSLWANKPYFTLYSIIFRLCGFKTNCYILFCPAQEHDSSSEYADIVQLFIHINKRLISFVLRIEDKLIFFGIIKYTFERDLIIN